MDDSRPTSSRNVRDLHLELQKVLGKARVSRQVFEQDQPPVHVQYIEVKVF